MNKRSRTTKPQPTKPAFSGSREPSPSPAGDRKGKDEGKRQQRSGGAASSASSGDEISANRSSSGEEATGRTRRPRRKERRRWDAVPMRYVVPNKEESSAPGISFINLNPAGTKSSRGKSTQKEKSSTSHSRGKKKAREEEILLSHVSRNMLLTMNPRGEIDVGDVEVSSGIAQSPNQEQQEHSEGSSDQAASNCEGDVQVVTEASAVPPSEVVSDCSIRVTGDIVKEDSLDDAKLLSRSRSVEAPEEASFDEETGTRLKAEEKPKPSSGDVGQIAQDEDGQHSDKIGATAIEGYIQGQGGAGGHAQALLDMDDDTISEKISYYLDQLKFDPPKDCDYLPPYEPQQLTEVYEQLALYRIRAYQLSVDRQLAELDDENLKKHYSSTDFYAEGYFQHYEESLEWYFDPELCKKPQFDDYQRLVLSEYELGQYRDWDRYRSTLNTYEKDMAYVQYCEALANETKWIEDHLEHSKYEWNRIKNVAKIQALQMAARFPNVSPRAVLFAFNEHIWSILFDHSHYARMDCVYFEIWKRVAKLKKDFKEALLELHRQNVFPLRALDIEYELKDLPRRFYMKDDYDAYVAVIDETASDDKARQHIMEAIVKMIPKPKVYLDYIKEKVDIAKDIWLIGKAPPQLTGDDKQS